MLFLGIVGVPAGLLFFGDANRTTALGDTGLSNGLFAADNA